MLELIKQFAQKAGLAQNPAWLKYLEDVKGNPALEPPVEVSQVLNSQLVSLADAKNHSDIINHFYSSVENPLRDTLKELGLEEADIATVMSSGKAPAKVQAGLKRLAELKEKAGKNNSTSAQKALDEEIKKVTDKLGADIDRLKNENSSLVSQYEADKIKWGYESALSDVKFSDAYKPKHARLATREAMQEWATANGAKIISGPSGLELRSAKNPDFPYVDEKLGRTLNFKEALDNVLLSEGLRQTGPAPIVTGYRTSSDIDGNKTTRPSVVGSQLPANYNKSLDALIDQQAFKE